MEFAGDRERRLLEYQAALEEERRKILVFRRELPLSLQLVTQAIESIGLPPQPTTTMTPAGFFSEASSEGPVLEEFIPLKPGSSSSMEVEENDEEEEESRRCFEVAGRPDWLRSVQLWSQNSEPDAEVSVPSPRKPIPFDARKSGGAFQPFDGKKSRPLVTAAGESPVVSTVAAVEVNSKFDGGGGGANEKEKEDEKEGSSSHQRKTRRCWSPELHRRFLHALQQLGGSHAATPKQIRELMKVDGLTNDEVKSHLQKYRLHTGRPVAAVRSGSVTQTQFVLLGGIWVHPPEYAEAAAAAAAGLHPLGPHAAPGGVCAPIAQPCPEAMPRSPTSSLHYEEESRVASAVGNAAENPSSPTTTLTSSSSDATTASPPDRKPT